MRFRRELRLDNAPLWRGFKRLTQLGFPRRFPLVQFPNGPLIVALIAGETSRQTHGLGRSYASSVGYIALSIWAYEELVHGVNWFRRLLGLFFAVLIVIRLAHALHA